MKFMMPRKFIKTARAVSGIAITASNVSPLSTRNVVADLPYPLYLLHPLYATLRRTVRDGGDVSLSGKTEVDHRYVTSES